MPTADRTEVCSNDRGAGVSTDSELWHSTPTALTAEQAIAKPNSDLEDTLLLADVQPAVAAEEVQSVIPHKASASAETDSLAAQAPSSATTLKASPPLLLPADAAATEPRSADFEDTAMSASPMSDVQPPLAAEQVQLVFQNDTPSSAETYGLLAPALGSATPKRPPLLLLPSDAAGTQTVDSVAIMPQLADHSQSGVVDAVAVMRQLMDQSQSAVEAQVQPYTAVMNAEELSANQSAAEQGPSLPVAAEEVPVTSALVRQVDTADAAVKAPRRSLLQKLRHKAMHNDTDLPQAAVLTATSSLAADEMPVSTMQKSDAFRGSLRHGSSTKTGQIPAVMDRNEPVGSSRVAGLIPDALDTAEPAAFSTRAGLLPAALDIADPALSSPGAGLSPAAPPDLALPVTIAMPSTEPASPLASPRKKSLFSGLRSTKSVVQQPFETQPELLHQQSSVHEAALQSPRQKGFKGLFRSTTFAGTSQDNYNLP